MEHLPGLSEREVLEGMTPSQLAAHAVYLGGMVTKIETSMNLVGEVLEAYGTSVEEQLQINEK